MSLFAFLGALETGFLFGIVALGVYLSFRILNFPDLTVDGSFPLGAAVAATLIVGGWGAWPATAAAFAAGGIAGIATAILRVRFGILHLLASILVMIALYSINLRIMGRPNIALLGEETVLSPFSDLAPSHWLAPAFFLVVAAAVFVLVNLFLHARAGLAMRAGGQNPEMAEAQGLSVGTLTLVGMALSNALVAFSGALFAQSQGFADVTMGVGVIVVGLAAVIGGEAILNPRTVLMATAACIVGAIVYRLAVALALDADWLGIEAQDLNLITAVLVAIALVFARTRLRLRMPSLFRRRRYDRT